MRRSGCGSVLRFSTQTARAAHTRTERRTRPSGIPRQVLRADEEDEGLHAPVVPLSPGSSATHDRALPPPTFAAGCARIRACTFKDV